MIEAPTPFIIDDALPEEYVSQGQGLKSAIRSALDRDPVDALNDALVLASILETRLRDRLGLAEI